ncbi:MAG: chloride channel protein, partial [Flavobacteriales bacterium]
VPNVLYAISKRNSMMKKRSMISSIITSALTVGFGGSVGLEGPTVSTSAAISSNLGKVLKLNYKTKTLLIGCASAAALAAIFKAPIAAIVFAIEVIMIDLTFRSLVPLLLASAVGTITSRLLLGEDVLFHLSIKEVFQFSNILFFVMLSIVTGLFSIYFERAYFYISHRIEGIDRPYLKAVVGGLILGTIIFFIPSLYGEGYQSVNGLIGGSSEQILQNSIFQSLQERFPMVMISLLAIAFIKVIAMSLTFSSGGIGGIFAPTLFLGSVLGFVFASISNHYGFATLSITTFTLVGMAGLMSGVLHAPLTAIFLISEITGDYELILPLMLVSAISYTTVKIFLPHSIYTLQLAKKGELITHHKDQAVLALLKLEAQIEKDFITVHPSQTLGELVQVVSRSKRNLYPVTDKENRFLGVVTLDDIRGIMFNRNLYSKTKVEDLMSIAPAHVDLHENMDVVMKKFEHTKAWNLPVVDEERYVGFVSKSKLFNAYREKLRDFYEE